MDRDRGTVTNLSPVPREALWQLANEVAFRNQCYSFSLNDLRGKAMWTCFWDWLGKLPASNASFIGTLTGSALGLIALLLGALFNAHLNRRRDDTLREADRTAVVAALRAELAGIHRTLIENAKRLIDKPPTEHEGFVVPDLSHSVLVFAHVLPKLGLLKSDTIRKIMDAYILVDQYSEGLILLGGRLQTNMPENRRAIYLDARHAETVTAINRHRAQAIQEAIDAPVPETRVSSAAPPLSKSQSGKTSAAESDEDLHKDSALTACGAMARARHGKSFQMVSHALSARAPIRITSAPDS